MEGMMDGSLDLKCVCCCLPSLFVEMLTLTLRKKFAIDVAAGVKLFARPVAPTWTVDTREEPSQTTLL